MQETRTSVGIPPRQCVFVLGIWILKSHLEQSHKSTVPIEVIEELTAELGEDNEELDGDADGSDTVEHPATDATLGAETTATANELTTASTLKSEADSTVHISRTSSKDSRMSGSSSTSKMVFPSSMSVVPMIDPLESERIFVLR